MKEQLATDNLQKNNKDQNKGIKDLE